MAGAQAARRTGGRAAQCAQHVAAFGRNAPGARGSGERTAGRRTRIHRLPALVGNQWAAAQYLWVSEARARSWYFKQFISIGNLKTSTKSHTFFPQILYRTRVSASAHNRWHLTQAVNGETCVFCVKSQPNTLDIPHTIYTNSLPRYTKNHPQND